MVFRIASFFAIGFVAMSATSANAQKGGDVSASRYGWVSSLQEGKAQASKTGKPMMVVIRCVP